jgi:hypothetical protein
MAALTVPRRINARLLAEAESSAAIFHRSGTEQLEHWAALGAAVESVMGLPTVARIKTLGRAANIDSLVAAAGTPAGNRKLARFLEKQAYPQYGITKRGIGVVAIRAKGGQGLAR